MAAGRFQPITSPYLKQQGATYYCWLLPGEELECPALSTGSYEAPHEAYVHGDGWVATEHGGFLYLFGPAETSHDERDCFFSVSSVSNSRDTSPTDQRPFPESLGPFQLASTELQLEVNVSAKTYCFARPTTPRRRLYDDASGSRGGRHTPNAQLALLASFGVTVDGKLSPVQQITLPTAARRQMLIPPQATQFCWAYQGLDVDRELTAEQTKQLDTDSAEISFVTLGGFVYLDSDGNVLRANAIGMGLGLACRIGTIDRPTCGHDCCDPEKPHRCDANNPESPLCDCNVRTRTGTVASTEREVLAPIKT